MSVLSKALRVLVRWNGARCYILCSIVSIKEVLREVLVKRQMVKDFSLYVPSLLESSHDQLSFSERRRLKMILNGYYYWTDDLTPLQYQPPKMAVAAICPFLQ